MYPFCLQIGTGIYNDIVGLLTRLRYSSIVIFFSPLVTKRLLYLTRILSSNTPQKLIIFLIIYNIQCDV